MKILLTNHHLLDFTGSEIFTVTLAKFLKKNGHTITIYSKYIDKLESLFNQEKIKLVDNLESIKNEKFDIAHVHHNINAIEIRNFFPNIPIIYLSHGILPFLEQPPLLDLGISKYLAVSEEVKKNLINNGISKNKIEIFRNIIDANIFKSKKQINKTPKKALILSSRIDNQTEKTIREACESLKISTKFIGGRFGYYKQTEIINFINEADIVFSLGRGAMEAMFCGRIPIIFDYLGGDGMVTPKTFKQLMKYNFSGRKYHKNYSKEELIVEIKKYNFNFGDELRLLAKKEFDAKTKITQLIKTYSEVSKERKKINLSTTDEKLIDYFYKSIQITREYTQNSIQITAINKLLKGKNIIRKKNDKLSYQNKLLQQKNDKLRSDLDKIQSSKAYKLWQTYIKIKKYF